MPMNSLSAFRPTEIGVKMILSPRGISLSYEMSFNEFRFQLKKRMTKSCRKYLRNAICKVIMLRAVIRNDFVLVKNLFIFYTIW